MTELQQVIVNMLSQLDISSPKKNEFLSFVNKKEEEVKQKRYFNLVIYFCIGLSLIVVALVFFSGDVEKASKFGGAVLGLFLAILALYNPSVTISQENCRDHLGVSLPAPNLNLINSHLEVAPKQLDKKLKLISALISYVAIYLLTFFDVSSCPSN